MGGWKGPGPRRGRAGLERRRRAAERGGGGGVPALRSPARAPLPPSCPRPPPRPGVAMTVSARRSLRAPPGWGRPPSGAGAAPTASRDGGARADPHVGAPGAGRLSAAGTTVSGSPPTPFSRDESPPETGRPSPHPPPGPRTKTRSPPRCQGRPSAGGARPARRGPVVARAGWAALTWPGKGGRPCGRWPKAGAGEKGASPEPIPGRLRQCPPGLGGASCEWGGSVMARFVLSLGLLCPGLSVPVAHVSLGASLLRSLLFPFHSQRKTEAWGGALVS